MGTLLARIKKLNQQEPVSGSSVIYVMSRDQRVTDNHALLAAAKHAHAKQLRLLIAFNIYPAVANRIYQQYEWMIEGLQQVEQQLYSMGIPFIVTVGKAIDFYGELVQKYSPEAIYFDFSPLRGPKNVKNDFAEQTTIPCFVVDTHNIVPVWETSDKEEFAAYTIRPKIYTKITDYLLEPEDIKEFLQNTSAKTSTTLQTTDWAFITKQIRAEKVPDYTPVVQSGENNAIKALQNFIENHLENYAELRNVPTENEQSNLSAYLHYGQLSSLRAVLEAKKYVEFKTGERLSFDLMRNKARKPTAQNKLIASAEAFIEEVVIRKELCDNFCYYNPNYDNVKGAKEWAIDSLTKHLTDTRSDMYTMKQLEFKQTKDKAWNAAQNQMVRTGKMHGYMRMYWAKKILEWTPNPQTAIKYAIYLNDKYHLDGYDPNGYAGIMWSIAGVHDRPWFEREIFGKIRYMNYQGLKRKFDIDSYIDQWS